MLAINKSNSRNQPRQLASSGLQSLSRRSSSSDDAPPPATSCSIPQLKTPDKSCSIDRAPAVTLATVASNADLWNHICGMMTGDAVHMLANMAAFKSATVITDAFIFLTGSDNDGHMVPWDDRDNVMARDWVDPRSHRKRTKSRFLYMPDSFRRNKRATAWAYDILAPGWSKFMKPYRYYSNGGPARPNSPANSPSSYSMKRHRDTFPFPSPEGTWDPAYKYTLPNPCHCEPRILAPYFCNGFSSEPIWHLLIGED